ncbi:MAG TPA: hypothetical protein VGD67_13770 [Pseudonocardiaceae bacterium]
MSPVKDAADGLVAALGAVDRLKVYTDPAATVTPPGVVLGPPSLAWEAYCTAPSSARFLVYVVEKGDARALERLWDLVPLVAEAVDSVAGAAVVRADPGSWGTPELPAYIIEVEYGL